MTNGENQEHSPIACLFNLLSFIHFARCEIEAKPNFLSFFVKWKEQEI